ncbi:hypothetical protein T484DRAFT_1918100 [Baffinella frigidus]|nr:hypothetical protein T484DRAFT_1918100 [Cryptophyta sp. CCMP2293]
MDHPRGAAFASEPKRFLAQRLLAGLMGGCVHTHVRVAGLTDAIGAIGFLIVSHDRCIHTHVRVAGKLTDAIGAIGFLIVSMIVAWLHHHEDPIAASRRGIEAFRFLMVSMIVAWLHHHEDPIAVVAALGGGIPTSFLEPLHLVLR